MFFDDITLYEPKRCSNLYVCRFLRFNKDARKQKQTIQEDKRWHCRSRITLPFFAGAKQAVQELEQLRERELCLEESEKTLEDQLRTREKAVADTIARTVKARGEEIARSYDAEIGKNGGSAEKG